MRGLVGARGRWYADAEQHLEAGAGVLHSTRARPLAPVLARVPGALGARSGTVGRGGRLGGLVIRDPRRRLYRRSGRSPSLGSCERGEAIRTLVAARRGVGPGGADRGAPANRTAGRRTCRGALARGTPPRRGARTPALEAREFGGSHDGRARRAGSGAAARIEGGAAGPRRRRTRASWRRAAARLARARAALRGRARTRRSGRRGRGQPPLARALHGSGPAGGGNRRPATARARRTARPARAAPKHAANPAGLTRGSSRCSPLSRTGSATPRSPQRLFVSRADGRPPRLRDPAQARRTTRAARRWRWRMSS